MSDLLLIMNPILLLNRRQPLDAVREWNLSLGTLQGGLTLPPSNVMPFVVHSQWKGWTAPGV
jgi:hypothetical protein